MILHHVPTERLAQLEKHLAGPFKREGAIAAISKHRFALYQTADKRSGQLSASLTTRQKQSFSTVERTWLLMVRH